MPDLAREAPFTRKDIGFCAISAPSVCARSASAGSHELAREGECVYPWGMASTPAHPLPASAPASLREGDVRAAPKDELDRRPHQERVRASMEWALDEYATTLAKLAK